MAERDMIKAVQAALDDRGIDDTVREVGQFEPRGMVGSIFAGGMIGSEVGGALGEVGDAIGLAAGTLGGMAAKRESSGLPMHMLVGASDSTIYGFAMAKGGRRHEPHDLLFHVPRDQLDVKVHGRVNVRVLELIDRETGSRIELEGGRIPITHSHDLIKFIAGHAAVEAADAASEESD